MYKIYNSWCEIICSNYTSINKDTDFMYKTKQCDLPWLKCTQLKNLKVDDDSMNSKETKR